MKRRTICLLALISISGVVSAYSPTDREIDVLFMESVAVANARVIAINGQCASDYCSIVYSLSIDSKQKGDLDSGHRVTVCSYAQLQLGAEYILFLGRGQPDFSGKQLCEYSVWHDGAFSKAGPRVYRYSSPDSSILIEHHGELYQTNAILVPEFDNNLLDAQRKANTNADR